MPYLKKKWKSAGFRYFVYGLIFAVVLFLIQMNTPVKLSDEDYAKIRVDNASITYKDGELFFGINAFMGGVSCSHNLSKIYGTYRWSQVAPYLNASVNLTNLGSIQNPEIPYLYPFTITIYNEGSNPIIGPTLNIKYDKDKLLRQVFLLNADSPIEDYVVDRELRFVEIASNWSVVYLDDLGPLETTKIGFVFLPDINQDCNRIFHVRFDFSDKLGKMNKSLFQELPIVEV